MTSATYIMKDSTEAQIVAKAKSGDQAAFSELVGRHHSWIRNLMRRSCGDMTLADDLSQQTFLMAWKNIKNLEEVVKFHGWLRQIAVSVWLQHIRKNDALRGADNTSDHEEAIITNARDTTVEMDLDRALLVLSPAQRIAIVLSYNENMTHMEIAETTGMPIGTVKSHIRRGTERLKEVLSAYDPNSKKEPDHA